MFRMYKRGDDDLVAALAWASFEATRGSMCLHRLVNLDDTDPYRAILY